MGPIAVAVQAQDPLSREGVRAQLQKSAEVTLISDSDPAKAQVVVLAADTVDAAALREVRTLRAEGSGRLVLVVGRVDDAGLLAAVEGGACGLLRRSEATMDALVVAIKLAAAGSGQLPPDLLGRLLEQVGRLYSTNLAPRGLSLSGLSQREVGVLKLVAEGWGTSEIAQSLAYSERTVKSVLHDITTRFNLRNRSHAVAYAVRQGLI